MYILDKATDKVIQSEYLTVRTDYKFAREYLIPLMDRLLVQRKIQASKFYKRLSTDIINGCILPSITIAFNDARLKQVVSEKTTNQLQSDDWILNNIEKAFVLDGIQRLNTLKNIPEDKLDLSTPFYVNIIFSDSMNKLLYRMIVLNNGQKPMSPRHQIEILMENIIKEFLEPIMDQQIFSTEKEETNNNIIKKSSLIKAYLAYVTQSINIDNQKIIETKLDEIITGQIIDSKVSEYQFEFTKIIEIIIKSVQTERKALEWFKNENNLIGFCSGISQNPMIINELDADIEKLLMIILLSDETADAFNFSKIKVGNLRRLIAQWLVQKYEDVKNNEYDIGDIISEISMLY